MYKFLLNNSFLFKDDPIFKPPEDDSEEDCYSSSNAGTGRALETLPRDKAIESIQAYDKIKSKLKDFFKPFAEQGKVVTEEEVRNFLVTLMIKTTTRDNKFYVVIFYKKNNSYLCTSIV